jgi:hypothetical protein
VGHFQSLAIVNSAATNMGVQVAVLNSAVHSFGLMPPGVQSLDHMVGLLLAFVFVFV